MEFLNDLNSFFKANKLTCIYGLCILSAIFGFIPPIPQVAVYLMTILYALWVMQLRHKLNGWVLALIIYIPFNILVAAPHALFRSWERYAFFVLLLMCVSPLFKSQKHSNKRLVIWQMLLWSCAFLGVGSFIGRFLGINCMVASQEDVLAQVGLFGGLTPHSMMLGPVAGIGAIFMAQQAYRTQKKFYWLLMACCLVAIMFSASRSALMASMGVLVVALYKLSGKVGKFIRLSVVAAVIAAGTFQFWGSALDGIIKKNAGNTSAIDTSSRASRWDSRIIEFENSPLIGVGFSALDPKVAVGEFDAGIGVIEPGSSWLSIFSMLGLTGAFLILGIFIRAFLRVWKTPNMHQATLVGVLTLLFIHMVAEGYIFSAGSFLCFVLWLAVGMAYEAKLLPKNIQ